MPTISSTTCQPSLSAPQGCWKGADPPTDPQSGELPWFVPPNSLRVNVHRDTAVCDWGFQGDVLLWRAQQNAQLSTTKLDFHSINARKTINYRCRQVLCCLATEEKSSRRRKRTGTVQRIGNDAQLRATGEDGNGELLQPMKPRKYEGNAGLPVAPK